MTNVLLIGSGAREHAIANELLGGGRPVSLFVAPGNAGTIEFNIDLAVDDHQAVLEFCETENIELVVVGPEGPLVDGLVDSLSNANIRAFGPTKAAAQLEGSKWFTRMFANRHGIAGPACERFTDVDAAIGWLDIMNVPVVVKADGLAGGKGVVVPEGRDETETAIRALLADDGAVIVLEERMTGEELSLIGFCDGSTVRALPLAQDHKRVGDGDTGLNTGGMGAFAPVPGLDAALAVQLEQEFLSATVKAMASDGTPYVGMLYAGLMLTPDGPRLVEYNCRFGDPEAQVLLPLMGADLLDVFDACIDGRLDEIDLALTDQSAATVVICADGYPASPVKAVEIPSVGSAAGVSVVHAGTSMLEGRVVSNGGRVLSIVALGDDLDSALDAAYATAGQFTATEGLFARSDIGWRHCPKRAVDAYARAGVSFSAGDEAIEQIADAVKETHNERVVAGVGSFGGVFDMANLGLDQPLLVSSTDTCGTKTVLAGELDMWDGIGADIVNHGVNDVLVQGARPLFMLDTISAGRIDPDIVGRVVRSMAAACAENDCVLLGGETAEVPDLIVPGGVDVAGTMVGVVDRPLLLPRSDLAAGDVLIGLSSSGLHTNGYSLARKLGAGYGFDKPVPGSDVPLGEALLAPHRSYLQPLHATLGLGGERALVKALAHLTGGGFLDNIPRCLPEGLGAEVDTGAWETPPLFAWLQQEAGIGTDEAHRIFNMGIGMVAVVAPADVAAFQAAVPEATFELGRLVEGKGVTLS